MWNRCGVNKHAIIGIMLNWIVMMEGLMWPCWDAEKAKTLNKIVDKRREAPVKKKECCDVKAKL